MGENRKSEREIFSEALEIRDTIQRAAFVARECAGEPDLRRRVETLLDAFASANEGEFMETRRIDVPPPPPSETTSHPAEGPGSLIGDYKLLQEIGEGGFGVVYMAEQVRPVKRKVALKIIKPGMDTREVAARFEAERQALALMSHANIAQVFDAGATDTGRPYFVMELVKGIHITKFCDKNKLSTVRRLNLFLDICGAIQHAHQKGVIHRDIKPSNILITLHDGVPVPKVIDFGIAKALNQELTEKTLFTAYGQMIGTPQYTSPEQAEMSGLDIDTRSDIYSLGVLLYELLTGETPISRNELKEAGFPEMQKLIQEKEATKPSMAVSVICRESTTLADFRQEEPAQLINRIKGDLDWIVLKALDKDRTRRYETAAGFADDVRRYLGNEPVTASPPTLPYLAGKFARRHKRALTAAASMVTVLIAATIGMTVLYFRARADRKDAVTARRTAESQTEAAQQARAAEAEQREKAQENAVRLNSTLARADLASAVDLLAQDDDRRALAHLARSLRTDPEFLPAAQTLVSALRDRNHHLDPEIVLRHESPVSEFSLSTDGDALLTRDIDGGVRLWNTGNWTSRGGFEAAGPFISAAFTADGSHIVALASNGVARVWNTRSASPRGSPVEPEGGAREVKSVNARDRLLLATRSGNDCLQLWDGLTGNSLTGPLTAKPGLKADWLGFSDDGSRLLGLFGNRLLACWDTRNGALTGAPVKVVHHSFLHASTSRDRVTYIDRSGKILQLWELESGSLVNQLNFPDRLVGVPRVNASESRLVAHFRKSSKTPGVRGIKLGAALTTRVIDLETGRILRTVNHGPTAEAPVVHAASGISLLRTGDFQIRARNLKTGRVMYELDLTERLFDGPASATIQFSPAGDRFLLRLTDNRFEVRRTLTGKSQALSERQASDFQDFVFSPDGQRVAAKMTGGIVRIWDVETALPLSPPFRHTMRAGRLLFMPDGKRIVSADTSTRDGRLNHGLLRVWNTEEGRAIIEPIDMPPRQSHFVVLSESNRVAFADLDGGLLILNADSGDFVRPAIAGETAFSSPRISPSDDKLTALTDGAGYVWDLNSSAPPLRLNSTNRIFGAKFSPDGSRLMTASTNATVRVWDAVTGEPRTPPLPTGRPVFQFHISRDNSRLAVATLKSVFTWDLTVTDPALTRREIARESMKSSKVEFSPDGRTALSISLNEAQIWNCDTGEMTASFAHSFNLRNAHFSSDARRILVNGPAVPGDTAIPGHAILWDTATRKRVLELPHPNQVYRARFSPDERFIVTSCKDRVVRVWHVETGALVSRTAAFPEPNPEIWVTRDNRKALVLSAGRVWLWPMPPAEPVIPGWLPELAEAVAGARLDADGNMEEVSSGELQTLRSQLTSLPGTGDFDRFARWFVADRAVRPLSPETTLTRAGLIGRLLDGNLGDGLRRAARMAPTNALVRARLAGKVTPSLEGDAASWRSFPEWHSLQAIHLAPDSARAWQAHADVLFHSGKPDAADLAAKRVAELAPGSPGATYLEALALSRTGGLPASYELFKSQLQRMALAPDSIDESEGGFERLRRRLASLDSPSPAQWIALSKRLAGNRLPGRPSKLHSDWLGRLAVEAAPSDTAVLAGRADALRTAGRADEAVTFLAEALKSFPKSAELWEAKARAFAKSGQRREALKAIDRSLELEPRDPGRDRRQFKLQLLETLGLADEARRLYLSLSIPARSAEAGANLIDLSAHYNAALTESWFPFMKWNGANLTLAALPTGVQTLDSVPFDIRGLIQVRSGHDAFRRKSPRLATSFPSKVSGIAAPGKWRTLHFLHATTGQNNPPEPDKFRIGAYLVHYADDASYEIPIELDKDVWNWIRSPGMPAKTKRSTVAWRDGSSGTQTRLFHTAWKNPRPEIPISHIDMVASSPGLHPFLVALTGEE